MNDSKKLKIIVLAAGKGKRMLSSTPKVMHNILDKPMLYYVLKQAYLLNPSCVYVVTGFGSEQIELFLQDSFPKAIPVFQNQQLGTGHAVNMVKKYLDDSWEEVLVLTGDSPLIQAKTLENLYENQKEGDYSCTILTSVMESPQGYGRIIKDDCGNVVKIIEESDASLQEKKIKEINSSIYCFKSKDLFDYLKRIKPENSQKEFYLTDIVEEMIKDNRRVSTVIADNYLDILGVNDRLALSNAAKIMQRRINENLMLAGGVTITDIDSAYISDDSIISKDTTILPNTFVYGKTVIESECIIGPSVQLYDCHIGKGTRINSAVLIEANIGNNNNIGPFSYVRPGTITDNTVKIGGFCEVKNSQIGKNSKIPHLTYIGDTEMGDNVNIGASSVTCNYDGFRKNKTIIGNNVFIGSDTMMVPPVKIGNGAIVAAGSVITENVPDNYLAVARGRQVNIEDGAVKYRKKKEIEKDEGANK